MTLHNPVTILAIWGGIGLLVLTHHEWRKLLGDWWRRWITHRREDW